MDQGRGSGEIGSPLRGVDLQEDHQGEEDQEDDPEAQEEGEEAHLRPFRLWETE